MDLETEKMVASLSELKLNHHALGAAFAFKGFREGHIDAMLPQVIEM